MVNNRVGKARNMKRGLKNAAFEDEDEAYNLNKSEWRNNPFKAYSRCYPTR